MTQVYFLFDTHGNITETHTSLPTEVPTGIQLIPLDGTLSIVQAAISNPTQYIVRNGALEPYSTIHAQVSAGTALGNFTQYTITITPPSGNTDPIGVTILGNSDSLPSQVSVTYNVAIHNSLTRFNIPATITGTNLNPLTVEIGNTQNSNAPANIQTYKDANGLLHIAPTQKATLLSYYTQQVPPASVIADIGTSLGMVSHFSYTKVPAAFRLLNSLLTWAQQATYSAFVPSEQDTADIQSITLTPDENNALADINANVIPSILTTLAEAAPKPAAGQPQSYDLHYASYSRHIKLSGQAFSDYVTDIQTIPNLV